MEWNVIFTRAIVLLYRHYTYIVGKIWKQTFDKLFCPVLQSVQIKFIFSNNVCLLCLFCNDKKSKTSAKMSKNSILIIFYGVPSDVHAHSVTISWNLFNMTVLVIYRSEFFHLIVSSHRLHKHWCLRRYVNKFSRICAKFDIYVFIIANNTYSSFWNHFEIVTRNYKRS